MVVSINILTNNLLLLQKILTALEMAKISVDIGLPAGVFNVVTGYGKDAGQAIVEHPGVDKVAFTGSVPTGAGVMRTASNDVKNVTLELGGKSAAIVFEDCDIDKAVEWVMFGCFWYVIYCYTLLNGVMICIFIKSVAHTFLCRLLLFPAHNNLLSLCNAALSSLAYIHTGLTDKSAVLRQDFWFLRKLQPSSLNV